MSKIEGVLETPKFLFKAQTNFVAVDEVKDAAFGGAFFGSGATATMQILHKVSGNQLTGSTATLVFQTNSAGRFEGTFDESVDITVGNPYLIEVIIANGGDVGLWRKELRGRYRD